MTAISHRNKRENFKIIKAHYESLESRKAELEELILALVAPYQQELAILQTAPGISSDFTAIGIISEIGTNMEAFPSAKHLCSWAGLTPTNNESAGKKNLSGLQSRMLYQAAFSTVRKRCC
ncbi:MAG: transposase [Coprococcus phoceensis]